MSVRFSFFFAAGLLAACSSPSSTTSAAPTPTPARSSATASAAASATAKTSTWDGVFTAAQAQHGATLFASTCNKCHGAQAAGTADDGGRLIGPDFFKNYDGTMLDQLFTSIYTLMPADNPKSLAPKDVADITAYLLSQNHMPAGGVALSEDASQLKGLKITAAKP